MILMSPGVSVVAAGLVSGLCFIIINGLRRGKADKDAKAKQVLDNTRCACCLKPFVVGRGVECGDCGSRACRKGCSRWDTPDNAWYCLFCHQRRLWLKKNEKWFETFGGLPADHEAAANCFSTAKSQVSLGEADYAGIGPGMGLAAGGEEEAGNSVERVREFVEKIVESLVGDVDEIPIDRLYDHQAYDQLMENYRELLAGALARLAVSLQLSITNKPAADTPTMAHAALRDLVERAVDEARKLPSLGNSDAGRSAETKDISEQTYEDLLATAILNKVIEKYQIEHVDDNSNTLHIRKTAPRTKYITSEIEVGLDEGVEEGSSSLEPLSQDEYSSDCSAPAPKYSPIRQEPLSLTIEEHIEEVTTTYTSDEEEQENGDTNGLDFRNAHRVPFPEFGMDIIDPSQESSDETQDEATTPTHVDLVTPIESWEENWLFQKKKMQAQSEPVSMLVPNPSEDFRPLIGDREADDTSDLSDCSAQSDEEIEEELLEAINNVGLKIPDSPGVNEVKEIVEVETRIVNNVTIAGETKTRTEIGKTTISIGHDNLIKNSSIDFQIEESGANGVTIVEQSGHDEEKKKTDLALSPEIKFDIKDMLVFHLKDKTTSNVEKEINHHQDRSIDFIEKEKSSFHLVSRDEKTDDIDVTNPEQVIGSKVTVEIQSRSETRNLLTNENSLSSYAEKTKDSLQTVESENESNLSVENGINSSRLTRDLKLFVDENQVSERNVNVQEDMNSSQLTRELKLLVNETNVIMENGGNLGQSTRDMKPFEDEINVNVENGMKSAQVTRELNQSVDETDFLKVDNSLQGRSHDVEPEVLEPISRPNLADDQVGVKDLALVSRDKDQIVNLDDDRETKELPRTPTSSPLSLETCIVPETGIHIDLHSLDEKLVSIETRNDTKLNSLNETFNSYVQRTEEVRSSLVSSVNNSTQIKEDGVVKAQLIFVDGVNKNSYITNTELHTNDLLIEDGAQQESEYTEHYATATQRHLDSLTRPAKITYITEVVVSSDDHQDDDIPPPIPSTPPPISKLRECRKASALGAIGTEIFFEPEVEERKRVEVDLFLATPPRPGTIAEREHKKWENAAPIENNPYSEENIQKRLLQRQYSGKLSSDTSVGENSEASKMAGNSMQVVLGAGQPDVKRYGRDYYINDARKSSGERIRRSAILNAGRRNSSLSQNSGSFDEDREPLQEQIQYKEPESTISNTVTEVKTKVSSWQQNNVDPNYNVVTTRGRQRVETTIQLGIAQDKIDPNEVDIVKSIESSISEVDNSWKGKNNDELLENVRRNSKNEVNAKLNNHQEDSERNAILEARNSLVNENRKSINRIDLKAYGFENEIKSNSNSVTKITSKRVVNKLDLKSFGYDSAKLQRIQSTGLIDAKLNNEMTNSKPTIVKMKTKSNLTEHNVDYERSKSTHNLVEYVEASGDFDKTKSTEIFDKHDTNLSQVFHGSGTGMISAKSMPNVTKIEHYSQNLSKIHGHEDEEEGDFIISNISMKREKFREEERLRQEMIRASAKSQGLWKSETILLTGEKTAPNNSSSDDETEDAIPPKSAWISSTQEINFEITTDLNTNSIPNNIEEDLPMPSVRRLAQTFIKEEVKKPIAKPRVWNANSNVKNGGRPTTPEVHIIETPRQMHSLTARSISKEFREGLRQIPNKINQQQTSHHIIAEQLVNVQNETEVVLQSDVDSSNNDIDIIAPGKLKNNIKFWEQLQRQS